MNKLFLITLLFILVTATFAHCKDTSTCMSWENGTFTEDDKVSFSKSITDLFNKTVKAAGLATDKKMDVTTTRGIFDSVCKSRPSISMKDAGLAFSEKARSMGYSMNYEGDPACKDWNIAYTEADKVYISGALADSFNRAVRAAGQEIGIPKVKELIDAICKSNPSITLKEAGTMFSEKAKTIGYVAK